MLRSKSARVASAALVAAVVAVSAFKTPALTRALQNKQEHHMVMSGVLNTFFTGQMANRGIVMLDSTIEPLANADLANANSEFMDKFFPGHRKLVALTAKDFAKSKKKVKMERQLLETRIKIDFLSSADANQTGFVGDSPTDSSWRILKEKFPEASNFIAFGVPGYDSGGEVALVSYYLLCGNGCYQKGYVLLERNQTTRQWRQLHRALVFGGG